MAGSTIPNAPSGQKTVVDGTEKLPISGNQFTLISAIAEYVKTAAPGYTIALGSASFSPADSTTYYFASRYTVVMSSAVTGMKAFVPKAGTIKSVYLEFSCTTGTSENSTVSIRLNDTTDTTIVTTLDLSASPRYISVTGLSVAVVAGDYVSIKWATPAWVTNPTAVDTNGLVYIE